MVLRSLPVSSGHLVRGPIQTIFPFLPGIATSKTRVQLVSRIRNIRQSGWKAGRDFPQKLVSTLPSVQKRRQQERHERPPSRCSEDEGTRLSQPPAPASLLSSLLVLTGVRRTPILCPPGCPAEGSAATTTTNNTNTNTAPISSLLSKPRPQPPCPSRNLRPHPHCFPSQLSQFGIFIPCLSSRFSLILIDCVFIIEKSIDTQ